MADATRQAQQQAAIAAAVAAVRPQLPPCINAGDSAPNTTITGLNEGNPIGADLLAFYNVLRTIGLNNGTIEELFCHGLLSLNKLVLFSEKDLDKFSKSVMTNKSPSATNDIWFPVKAQLNLQYLRLWGVLQKMCGIPLLYEQWDPAKPMVIVPP